MGWSGRVGRPNPHSFVLGVALMSCATTRELDLPDVRQSTGYTCSAAVLLSVLAYFGQESREDRLVEELGATEESGAPPDAIVRVARAHGLKAELREGMSVEELATEISLGNPVIVDLQAWVDQPTEFATNWDDGHYVVVVAVEDDLVIFEDPSVLGARSVLTRRELEERWHDTDGSRKYLQLGIVFSGDRPNRESRVHMD